MRILETFNFKENGHVLSHFAGVFLLMGSSITTQVHNASPPTPKVDEDGISSLCDAFRAQLADKIYAPHYRLFLKGSECNSFIRVAANDTAEAQNHSGYDTYMSKAKKSAT